MPFKSFPVTIGGGGGLRQPINITLDGKDVLAKFVLEVVGDQVKVEQSRS